MPKVEITQLNSVKDPTWLKSELLKLKRRTLTLVIISFATLGVLVGYYLFSGVFKGTFQNVTYAAADSSNLRIEWETKFPARTRVEYGTNEIYLNETSFTSEYSMDHGISLEGLLPDKAHVFRLIAEDNTGKKFMSPFYQTK